METPNRPSGSELEPEVGGHMAFLTGGFDAEADKHSVELIVAKIEAPDKLTKLRCANSISHLKVLLKVYHHAHSIARYYLSLGRERVAEVTPPRHC